MSWRMGCARWGSISAEILLEGSALQCITVVEACQVLRVRTLAKALVVLPCKQAFEASVHRQRCYEDRVLDGAARIAQGQTRLGQREAAVQAATAYTKEQREGLLAAREGLFRRMHQVSGQCADGCLLTTMQAATAYTKEQREGLLAARQGPFPAHAPGLGAVR